MKNKIVFGFLSVLMISGVSMASSPIPNGNFDSFGTVSINPTTGIRGAPGFERVTTNPAGEMRIEYFLNEKRLKDNKPNGTRDILLNQNGRLSRMNKVISDSYNRR